MDEKDIKVKTQKVPEDLRKEVLDYVDFLLMKHNIKEKKRKSSNLAKGDCRN